MSNIDTVMAAAKNAPANTPTAIMGELLRTTTGEMTQETMGKVKGKIIYSRGRKSVGHVQKVSHRTCAVCGYHTCYIVKWDDTGRMTKPCTAGVKSNPDGTLEIE